MQHTVAEILEFVLEQAAELLGSDAGAIYLIEEEQGEAILKVGASRGLTADRVALRLRIGSPVTGLAVLKRRPVAFTDLRRALADNAAQDAELRVEDRGSHLV